MAYTINKAPINNPGTTPAINRSLTDSPDAIPYMINGILGVFKESFFAILSPVIILGCIYTGIASPTEAAVISVFYSLVVSLFIYKSMKFKDIWGIMVEGVRTYAPILFILAASIAFSRV